MFGSSDASALPARIVGLSRAAAQVIVGEQFEPGSLIGVEAAGADGSRLALLACVLHARPHEHEWILSCHFSRGLSDEDLRTFGLEQKEPFLPSRQTLRRGLGVRAVCCPLSSVDPASWECGVIGLHPGGLAFVTEQAVEIGAVVTVRLVGPGGNVLPDLLTSIVRVATAPDGSRIVEGTFIRELNEGEYRSLLSQETGS
jgi:hypothetical protein